MEDRIRSSTDSTLERIRDCITQYNIHRSDVKLLLESLIVALKGEEAATKKLGAIRAILDRQYHLSAEDDIEEIRRVMK